MDRFTHILGYEFCSLCEDNSVTKMQNSNKNVVPLLEFVSMCNAG